MRSDKLTPSEHDHLCSVDLTCRCRSFPRIASSNNRSRYHVGKSVQVPENRPSRHRCRPGIEQHAWKAQTRTQHHADILVNEIMQAFGRYRLLPTIRPRNEALHLALVLTITSFWVANTSVLWTPGVPAGLAVLAIAQMGVHLVFFLHITTGPDNTNNILALAFGVLIVFLVLAGSLVIMANLNENMAAHTELMNLHMQH